MRLLDYVDDPEHSDPDHVDEVPVVGSHDGKRCLMLPEALRGEGAAKHEQEGNEPADHVQAVESSREEKYRAVGTGGDGKSSFHQLGVLENCPGTERATMKLVKVEQSCHPQPTALKAGPG